MVYTPNHGAVLRFIKQILFLLLLCFITYGQVYAQAYISSSRTIGATNQDYVTQLVVDNGYSYVLLYGNGNNFPVTLDGAGLGSGTKSRLIKLDADGNIIWSRYLPQSTTGTGATTYGKMALSNGIIHLVGNTSATNVPVTDGSIAAGGGSDILYTKVDALSGNILHTGYLGGNGAEGGGQDIKTENNNVYLTFITQSSNIPVTTGPAYTSGFDHIIMKLNSSGVVVYSTYTGSASSTVTNTDKTSLQVENGEVWLAMLVDATHNITTTDGSVAQGGYDFAIVRLDVSGNTISRTIYGGSDNEDYPFIAVKNAEVYLTGFTASINYPVTDATVRTQATGHIITKFKSNNNRSYSSYIAGVGASSDMPQMQVVGGAIYLLVSAHTSLTITTTDGSSGGSYLVKLDAASGVRQFATAFGGMRNFATITNSTSLAIEEGYVYTATPVQNASTLASTTDGSSRKGHIGVFITRHSITGQLHVASWLASASSVGGFPFKMAVSNGKLFLSGSAVNGVFPVTMPNIGTLNMADFVWTAIEFCPTFPTGNNISPLSQSVCKDGFTQVLTGNKVAYTSDNMPMLYISGVATPQNEIRARYQWQVADNPSGPWTNILGSGTQKDFSPPSTSVNKYYRRLVLAPLGCTPELISTSAVASILVSTENAPQVDAGIFNTCVGSPVNINVTVTGGVAPYTYTWDNGVASTTNSATVTPTGNSVYTATVIDANGCKQVGQAIVNAYTADAGPATTAVCAGQQVRIGTPPPAGLAGVAYSWSPATGLDNPNIAQPLASPLANTTYTLTMTLPISGGGTCSTTDNIDVNVVTGPSADFAGDDKVICKGGTTTLGIAPEAGFTYTWAPGNYLSVVNTSTVTFNAGSELPGPNYFVYTLTATKSGCSFTDKAKVSVLEANAGKDYCGPRTVGVPDPMPGVPGKIFLWEKVSGPGNITGATNTPTTTVSASVGATTIYRLTVSLDGTSCTDEVSVSDCGVSICPSPDIKVVAKYTCPSVALSPVTLIATPSNLPADEWTYSWSSSTGAGISSTTGTSITLTDNIEKDVTLTITHKDNPIISCSKTIHVNQPSWSAPVFPAQDKSICEGTTISIGLAPVAGYNYTWSNVLPADINISNPSVTPSATTNYEVIVTDNASGCALKDTVQVKVKPLINDPGPDRAVCSNSTIILGSPAQPNYTYSWIPAVASYQGGTNHQSAEPKVLVAADQDFTLTVTDTETGCTSNKTVHITVDNTNTLPPIANVAICLGGNTVIGNPGWPGVKYSWSPATGLSNATVAQPIASPIVTTTYTLTATFYDANGASTCVKTGATTVTVNSPVITMNDESICPSGTLYNLSTGVTVTGASTYGWSPALLVTNPSALSTTVKANPSTATQFTLTATDINGCKASATKTISPINPPPIAGSNGYVCYGSSVQLGHNSNTGGLTWSWTVDPVAAMAGTLSSYSDPAPVYTPAETDIGKTFTFTVTQNMGGCINSNSVKIQVKGFTLPPIPVQTVCLNASASIGVAHVNGRTYQWTPTTNLTNSTSASTLVNNIAGTSTYTLVATDAMGCVAETKAIVGVNPAPAPTVNIPDVVVSLGSEGTPFAPKINPNGNGYTYTWAPPTALDNPYIANAKATPAGLGTTNYTLTVTDDKGCTSIGQASLTVVSYAAIDADIVTVKKLKDAAKTGYIPGEDVVYTITVTNDGPGDAYNVNIKDPAPAVGTSINNWTAAVTNGTVALANTSGTGNLDETIATLPAGAVVTYEVTVRTTLGFTSPLSNTVTVTSPSPDPDPSCPGCTTSFLPKTSQADIVTVKTLKNINQTNFIAGEAVVYIITVTNNGPDDASGVTITDNAPAGTTISNWSAVVKSGSIILPHANGNGNLNETIANFPNGAIVTYEVTVQTPVTFTGDLINTAQASSITVDPDPACTGCSAPPLISLPAPPTAINNDTTTKEGMPVTIRILDNDIVGPSGSPLVLSAIEIVTQPAHGTVTINPDGTVVYTPNPGYTGEDSFTYRVQAENGQWSNVATVNITVLKNEIHVPNVITPNGDGINDKLVIQGLEKYQANQLLIFNRWNSKIYESKNYMGDWDGRGLNPGTYFYALRLQDNNGQWHKVNGYITLIR